MFNSKAAENVSCWFCEHFQRYDAGPEPSGCIGECRLKAFISGSSGATTGNGGESVQETPFFPVISQGVQFWCSSFQRTREKNLPPAPAQDEENEVCLEEAVIPDDVQEFRSSPWSKKLLIGYVSEPIKGSSCQNCDHYQGERETGSDRGECRKYPLARYVEGVFPVDVSYYKIGKNVRIGTAHCWWCSEWTRSRLPLVELPSYSCTEREHLKSRNNEPGREVKAVTPKKKKTKKEEPEKPTS